MPVVIMPEGASAAGEAFELLTSRYLCEVSHLEHLAAPFYKRLERGRWVQFDGLFSRHGDERLVLEAKFHQAPVTLATAGIAARLTFAKESGASGIIIASKKGFHRDLVRVRLPIEKVLLSWQGMRRGLGRKRGALLTSALDPVTADREGYTAASGAKLRVRQEVAAAGDEEGLAYVGAEIERWLRRLPASSRDIDIARPHGRWSATGRLDIEGAWRIEDSLRGFAPADPRLMEQTAGALRDGPLTAQEAWKSLWRLGYRGRKGGVKNALENLRVMGAAEKFRTEKGLFYGLHERSRGYAEDAGIIEAALGRWPAFGYFRVELGRGDGDKHALAARLSERFARFFPYARSLYNPAKVAGLLALDSYTSSKSRTRPS